MSIRLPEYPGTRPRTDRPTAGPLRLLFWESTTGCNLACVHCRRLEVSQALSKLDMTTEQALAMIRSLPETGKPIVVFSGGEPLMRPDVFELAEAASALGLPTALATNGTLVDDSVARKVVASGFRRVSISFDGPDAPTHDIFRGPGAFDESIAGFQALRSAGMSMQINTTIARHNFHKLDQTYQLALDLGAEALHLFMLVPVGCGMELDESVMLSGEEYEQTLNWIYERSQQGGLHMKATCAPHYFRVIRQRAKAEGKPMPQAHHPHAQHEHGHVAATEPGHANGQVHHEHAHGGASPHGGHPGPDMAAMTKGCLAGQAVCFVSHTGEVFPCGYLPVSSGNVKETPLPQIWRDSDIFADLRDEKNLQGKCGACEFGKVCMGCRARAYAQTHDYLAQEPNCDYVPMRMRGNAGE